MLAFVKNFKTLIPKSFVTILLAVLSVFAVFIRLANAITFMDYLINFLPIALIVFAVLLLDFKGHTLEAHIILLIMVFGDALGTFFRAIFSYNFGLKDWTATFDWQLFVGLIICVYLMLYVASYILTKDYKVSTLKSSLTFPLLLLVAYLYLRYGFTTAIISAIPILIALMSGVHLAALALMLCQVIQTPFAIIDLILATNGLKFTSITYWLVSLAALYLIYLFVVYGLKLIKKTK
jgi:uncharacterized membrane protein YuzA (DUF378 family)